MSREPHDLAALHKRSIRHRSAVEAASLCGCFYCRALFTPADIRDWVDDDATGVGQTALCPRCGIDAVLPSSATLQVNDDLLRSMYIRFFT
jgi:hypothetical protein